MGSLVDLGMILRFEWSMDRFMGLSVPDHLTGVRNTGQPTAIDYDSARFPIESVRQCVQDLFLVQADPSQAPAGGHPPTPGATLTAKRLKSLFLRR